MAAGQKTAADSMIKAVGAQNAMHNFSSYRPLSQEGLIYSQPDLIVVSEQGVKSLGGVDKVWELPGLALTPAGKNRALLVVDDTGMLSFSLGTPKVMQQLREALEKKRMSRFKHPLFKILMLLVLLGAVTVAASTAGTIHLPLKALWFAPSTDPDWQIWLTIRLPRVLLAILVGLALAVSGAMMQGYFATSRRPKFIRDQQWCRIVCGRIHHFTVLFAHINAQLRSSWRCIRWQFSGFADHF